MNAPDLLVTTHSGVFGVNPSTGEATRFRSGYFYGADYLSGGRLHLAERAEPEKEPFSPTRFHLGEETWLDDSILNVHQLTRIGDLIYVCDTGHDRVVAFRESDLRSPVFSISVTEGNSDSCHVNSVAPCGEQVAVNLHMRGQGPAQLLLLNPDTQEMTRLSLHIPSTHNLEFDDRYCYFNASASGQLMRSAKKPDSAGGALTLGGHPKGMARKDSTLFVGVSGVVSRADRKTAESYIATIDIDRWVVEDIVPVCFEGAPIGNINEVRIP